MARMKKGRPFVRLGCGSAFPADRIQPAVDLVEHAELDFLSLECLGERTLGLAQLQRLDKPDEGWDDRLDEKTRKLLGPCVKHKVRLVSNMGAANPIGAAERVARLLREMGLTGVKIAAITGDDVMKAIGNRPVAIPETGTRWDDLPGRVVSANAYIGIEGILTALAADADIVIGGRLADPSLYLGPAAFALDWSPSDWDLMATGQCTGHLLECGNIVTGGYFSDPPYNVVPDPWNLGNPIADVWADRRSEIWKLDGTGGAVSVNTCKAQLLYEIHDPSAYLTPDVSLDVTRVTLAEVAPNRVRVEGARGRARPETLKVLIGVHEGYLGQGEISFGGLGAVGRARMAADAVKMRLDKDGFREGEILVELIGHDSLLGPPPAHLNLPEPWEVRLRMAARCKTAEAAQQLAHEVFLMYCGPAGAGGAASAVRPILGMHATAIGREEISIDVHYFRS